MIDNDMDGYDSSEDCNDSDYLVNPGMPEICADMMDNNCNGVVDEEGCTGGTEGCNPEILLVSDSAMWSETPGVVWILFPFDPSNTASFVWDFGDGNTSTEPFPTNIYDVALDRGDFWYYAGDPVNAPVAPSACPSVGPAVYPAIASAGWPLKRSSR